MQNSTYPLSFNRDTAWLSSVITICERTTKACEVHLQHAQFADPSYSNIPRYISQVFTEIKDICRISLNIKEPRAAGRELSAQFRVKILDLLAAIHQIEHQLSSMEGASSSPAAGAATSKGLQVGSGDKGNQILEELERARGCLEAIIQASERDKPR